jgi:DNA replication protein DnaC
MERVGTVLSRGNWPASFDDLIDQFRALSPDELATLTAEAEERNALEAQEQRRIWLIDWARKQSDLGELFADRTFANFEIPPGDAGAFEKAKQVADEPLRYGAWFQSQNKGPGKTHLAAAIVNDCTSRGIAATFLSAARFFDRLREVYSKNGDVKAGMVDILDALAVVPVLVIDDLDKPRPNDWFAERLYILVNNRIEAKRKCIVTSNLTPAEVQIRWEAAGGECGSAVIDRLKGMCTLKVRVSGESYRGRA